MCYLVAYMNHRSCHVTDCFTWKIASFATSGGILHVLEFLDRIVKLLAYIHNMAHTMKFMHAKQAANPIPEQSMMQDPGLPRLVSLIVYLTSSWGLDEHAETLFLDGATDTGVCVRPRPGRMVVLDQDIMHRVCAPSLAAKRPRYFSVFLLNIW
jgi:hypothetical protein